MSQRGNILFLILLAVVLFAALAYAVTSSLRGGGQSASPEKAQAAAAAIVQTGSMVEQGVARMMLINNCKDTQVTFASTVVGYYAPNSPADRRCHVFDPAGGGLTIPSMDKSYYDPARSGASLWGGYVFVANPVEDIGLNCGSPYEACAELMMIVPFLRKDVCQAINAMQGITTIPQVTGTMQMNKFSTYQNETSAGSVNTGKWMGGPVMKGRHGLCVEGKDDIYGTLGNYSGSNSAVGTYHYYHVLIAR
jgi:hypothetical protein